MKSTLITLAAAALLLAACGEDAEEATDKKAAETVTVDMFRTVTAGEGTGIGTVTFTDSQYGLMITPSLNGLKPGAHGFHVHENPDCGLIGKPDGSVVAGGAAGGHYDPGRTGRHEGPYGLGHLGDLPVLVVDGDGGASLPLLAPRLTVADIRTRALMVHAGGDNYSDEPKALGGGGSRVACGIIPAAAE